MRIAVEGCSHGELDLIYDKVLARERSDGQFFDALLLCGDFQAIRNHADLHSLAVPDKYRQLGAFWQYFAGVKRAPLLTLVIGGNHEASNYMYELYHGGWLAPNIYYLGEAGCVEVGDLVVSGISGIYKKHDYYRGRYERQPYNNNDLRSIYHTRVYDIERLKLLPRADIVMSHDWPNTIEQHGDTARLIRQKPFFADEIATQTLGSPPLLDLLQTLKPALWCSAHLHVHFEATYRHDGSQASSSSSMARNGSAPVSARTNVSATGSDPNQIDIDDFDDDDDPPPSTTTVPSAGPSRPAPADPNEIAIDDEDEAGGSSSTSTSAPPASALPVTKDFGDAEEPLVSVDESGLARPSTHVDDGTTSSGSTTVNAVIKDGKAKETKFVALGKCVPKQRFLEFYEVTKTSTGEVEIRVLPQHHQQQHQGRQRHQPTTTNYNNDAEASASASVTSGLTKQQRRTPTLRFHEPWLAIVRATHPWFSTEMRQEPFPPLVLGSDQGQGQGYGQGQGQGRGQGLGGLGAMVAEARGWIREHIVRPHVRGGSTRAGDKVEDNHNRDNVDEKQKDGEDEEHDAHPLSITRIQQFVPTAPFPPPESLRMGKKLDLRRVPPSPPYLNPQTAAFCAFVGIDNRINTPSGLGAPSRGGGGGGVGGVGPPRLLDVSRVPDFAGSAAASGVGSREVEMGLETGKMNGEGAPVGGS